MMFGGGLMLGMGLLVMLLVFSLPILLVLAVVGGMAGLFRKQNHSTQQVPVYYSTGRVAAQPASTPALYCAHCGAGMKSDWSHCPQCGAPIN